MVKEKVFRVLKFWAVLAILIGYIVLSAWLGVRFGPVAIIASFILPFLIFISWIVYDSDF